MPIWPFQVSGPAQGEVPPFVPQPSSTRQVSSTGLSRRCCLRASPDRPTRLRLAVPKWTRRQGEETPLGPSSGEETPISQDGMSYRVRSLPSSLFHPSNQALPSDCVARVEKLTRGSSCDCSSPSLQVGWLGRVLLLSFCPGTPLPLPGNVCLGFPA